jgi:hypothetical protein
MRPSSAKAKGRRLQQEVRDLILERFSELFRGMQKSRINFNLVVP